MSSRTFSLHAHDWSHDEARKQALDDSDELEMGLRWDAMHHESGTLEHDIRLALADIAVGARTAWQRSKVHVGLTPSYRAATFALGDGTHIVDRTLRDDNVSDSREQSDHIARLVVGRYNPLPRAGGEARRVFDAETVIEILPDNSVVAAMYDWTGPKHTEQPISLSPNVIGRFMGPDGLLARLAINQTT